MDTNRQTLGVHYMLAIYMVELGDRKLCSKFWTNYSVQVRILLHSFSVYRASKI